MKKDVSRKPSASSKQPAAVGPDVRTISARRFWAMKRKQQSRDRELIARGVVQPDAMLLIRPERLHGAKIEWPKCSLLDN